MEISDIERIIAVDPGANGGIAIYRLGASARTYKIPKDVKELNELINHNSQNAVVVCERLNVRPDDITPTANGNKFGKIFRVQKLMANYEMLKTIFRISNLPICYVSPVTWQTRLGLKALPHETKQQRKSRYKEFAGKLYPYIKTTLWNADALLILHWARIMIAQEPATIKNNIIRNQKK